MEYDDLLEKARKGDIQAFHTLFNQFQASLHSYLYRLVNDRNDVEDLAHDTFLKALEGVKTFQGKSSLKTWVFTIATNIARNVLAKRNRWEVDAQDRCRESLQNSPEERQPLIQINLHSPQGNYEIREHIDFCFTCISKTLPLEQQVALILKDIYHFKVKEIADIINKSVGVIKHLLRDARQTMIAVFDERCSLVNKNGTCHQCTELNGIFNPEQQHRQQLLELEIGGRSETEQGRALLKIRAELVSNIDPLNCSGTELHDALNQHMRGVISDDNQRD